MNKHLGFVKVMIEDHLQPKQWCSTNSAKTLNLLLSCKQTTVSRPGPVRLFPSNPNKREQTSVDLLKLAITSQYWNTEKFLILDILNFKKKKKNICQAHTIDVMLASIRYPVFNPEKKNI